MFEITAKHAAIPIQPFNQFISGSQNFLEVQGTHPDPLDFRDSTCRYPFFYSIAQRLYGFLHAHNDVPRNDGIYVNLTMMSIAVYKSPMTRTLTVRLVTRAMLVDCTVMS